RFPPGTSTAMTSREDREGKRRRIPWDELDATALDEAARLKVGITWRSRRKQQHLAGGAFALLTAELAATGSDPVALGLVNRAVSDEARHDEICRQVAVHLLGETAVPARVRGVPKVPSYPGAPPEARTLFHVVEMCCLSETFTGVYLTEMLARTKS